MKPRLGVNIDHVATLRQARGEDYPSIVDAASVCLKNGADQITIHLREDRRHIQDTDVEAVSLVTKRYGKPLNLELGCNDEIIDIAIATAPNWICIVPEKREERTTEGGLDIVTPESFERVKNAMEKLRAGIKDVKISLFVEAEPRTLEACRMLGPEAVEIHTGDYAMAFLNTEGIEAYITQFASGKKIMDDAGIAYHAGHGLTHDSVKPLLESKLFEEYNIGHWMICQSIFDGLGPVTKKMSDLFHQ